MTKEQFNKELNSVKTFDEEVNLYIKYGLKDSNLRPLKCICGCEDFKEEITDTLDIIVCEKRIVCKECGSIVGYWAYGSYEI